VAVKLTILGSGSSGNCAYVETEETRILVDAGFSPRQILITHEHSDHIQGLAGIAEKLGIPVYCNRATKDEIERLQKVRLDSHIFSTGDSFEVGDISVDTFAIPHDAQDPVGFLLRTSSGNIGFATDLGHVTRLVAERVRAANVLLLEANHDVKMLQECVRRPWSLKQRILSRHGHLSNEAAADCTADIMTANLRHLFLGHLSRECNDPDLAFRVVGNRLQEIGATHVSLSLTSQNVPCPTLSLQHGSAP
jgi:phosphoribosyl 1,2-cyclic phosphodiesterase